MPLDRNEEFEQMPEGMPDVPPGVDAQEWMRIELEIDGMDNRCQPIGCDSGYHLPGCPYQAIDEEL